MKKNGWLMGLGLAAAAGVAISLSVAAPASAAQSNCPSIDFCLWDPPGWQGSPTVYVGAFNTIGGQFEVPENVTSSGDNRRGVGHAYCGLDDDGTLEGVWPINTAVSLTGGQSNVIDLVFYGGDNCE